MFRETFLFESLDPESEKILKETFTSKYRKNYIRCEGFLFSESLKNFTDTIRNLEIRDDDVWVCTFPKAGTTWVQEMIWCLKNGLNHEDVKKCINDRVAFFEFSALCDVFETSDLPKNSIEDVEKLPSPRLIKTHLPFNLLPKKLQNFSTNAKIIHVVRNPRDTLISYYHHCRLIEDYRGTFPQFAKMFFKGTVPYAPFPAHLRGFLAHEGNSNILFLKYEEMQKDLKLVIRKTANFIGKSISEPEVEELFDHLSFSSMKQNPAVNYEPFIEVKKQLKLIDENEGHFMRRGIVGDWKDRLDPELCQEFQKWERENLNEVDFTFSV